MASAASAAELQVHTTCPVPDRHRGAAGRQWFYIDGKKTWISNGGIADLYVVFALTGEAESRGLSAFIVEGGNPVLSTAERIDVIAPHPLARLKFDGCCVAADALVGALGDGFKIAMATLDVFRTTVGAAALGFTRRAISETLARRQPEIVRRAAE